MANNLKELLEGNVQQGPGPIPAQNNSSIETLTQGQEKLPLNFGPPANDVDLQERRSGWQNFVQAVRSNPSLRNAILMASGELLKGHATGENPGAPFGRAVQVGTNVHAVGKAQEAQQQLLARQEDRATRESDVNIAHRQALTESTRDQTAFEQQRRPLQLQEQQNLLQQQQFQLDNQELLLDEELKNSVAQRDLQSAQALYARARAAVAGREGSRQPTTAEVQMQLFRMANPEASEQEIAQMALDYGKKDSSSLNAEIRALTELVNFGDERDEFTQQSRKQLALHLGLQAQNQEQGGGQDTSANPREWTPEKIRQFKQASKTAGADGRFQFDGKTWVLN